MSDIKSSLELNNLTDFDVSEDFLSEILKQTFSEVSLKCLIGKKTLISSAMVSEKEIAKLNLEYRKINEATDVLSFSEHAKIQDLCNNEEEEVFLGEIILCPSYIEKSSIKQGVSFEFELAYIFSHGILHLLGFAHGEKMFSIQNKVAEKI